MSLDKARVAAIPSDTKIIVNVGSVDDPQRIKTKIGQKIAVYTPGMVVTDPLSHEHLGSYDPIIAKLEITEVYERFLVARKIDRERNSLSNSPMLRSSNRTHYEKLPVDENDISKNVRAKKVINLGDPVKFLR